MNHISIVSIPVSDQQRAKEFYLKFGFELIIEAPLGPDQKWVQMALPGAPHTTIALVTWFPEMPVGSLRGFVIHCNDLDAELATLQSKGIKAEPIDQTPWGRFAAVIDPDGNRLSLHQE
ncbi:VOC family protein [Mucilaginibacter ginkgonis]|uniref:VOC family protein n=1 Tax=Mucilaginibacter ginkgonis TaxID=2682091 RepID=A0A6I4HX39_9SPHI|nr:VOC family protein [Mucilaginibacter ginkgonis]QQL51406.1 VOC family protein [Mucilaginibacter ginkgonis]